MSVQIGEQLVALLPRLRRFAISLARNRETADDLVQIACERALANAASWQPGSRFDAWMFTILRNAWYDRLRRNMTEGIKEDIEGHLEIAGGDAANETEARLTLKATWKAIGELPDDQREVLMLTCVEEFSYKEAADLLGVPIGTIMSRLARARTKIAKQVGISPAGKR